MTTLNQRIGLSETPIPQHKVFQYLNLKLALMGLPTADNGDGDELKGMIASLFSHEQETERLLADYLPPADQRIQDFLDRLSAANTKSRALPGRTFVLDQYGSGARAFVAAGQRRIRLRHCEILSC